VSSIFDLNTQRAVLAELVGTFFLTLAALVSGTPYAVALTLTAFVYAIGDISGCNINPAVTIGLVTVRRLPFWKGLYYVVAQVEGALLALLVAGRVGGLAPHYAPTGPWGEFLGVGFLVLTVVSLSHGYVPKSGSGIAIGAALAAGLLTTKGILNPAVAVAMGQALSPGTWAAALGGVLFALLFRLYAPKDESGKPKVASSE
jgi:aquaporin Z